MDSQLEAADKLQGESRKVAYHQVIAELRENGKEEDYENFLHHVVSMSYGTVGQQVFIDGVVASVKGKAGFEAKVLELVLQALKSSISLYEEQDKQVRLRLADIYQGGEDYLKAARVLQGLISGRRNVSDKELFDIYIRIIRNYLEAEQPENAAFYLNRAQYLRPTLGKIDPILEIHFKLCQARIYDSSNDFIRAAMRYFDVSRELAVEEDDRLAALARAVVCTVLAQPGAERSQMLKNMYGDDRSRQLPQFRILKKVYLEQLLNEADIEEFQHQLSPSQMAKNPDGTTVLSRAVIDHNLMSVSKLYDNIGLAELAKLLGLSEAQVETYTAQIVSKGKLNAVIEQEQGYVYFNASESNQAAVEPLAANDGSIESAYTMLEDIVGEIEQQRRERLPIAASAGMEK